MQQDAAGQFAIGSLDALSGTQQKPNNIALQIVIHFFDDTYDFGRFAWQLGTRGVAMAEFSC